MAEHREVEYATAEGNDYAEHENTYRMFVKLSKFAVIAAAILLILMAINLL